LLNDLIYQVIIFFLFPDLAIEMANNRDEQTLRDFGLNLKRLREGRNMTTREFADLANIALSQVWTLESGKGDPSLTTLIAISKCLNVTIQDLILQ
jgi:DNA-binding XRE family transcriptional regulator